MLAAATQSRCWPCGESGVSTGFCGKHWIKAPFCPVSAPARYAGLSRALTDSVPGELTPLDCLGFLPGSCAPHYDGEPDRRPRFHRLIGKGEMTDGYGIDDKAGLHFIGGELLRVVAATAAAAYRVEQLTTGVSETELDASTIVRLQESGGDQDIETDKRTDSQ